MKFTTALAATLMVFTPAIALAQGTTKDGATANEKPGQGTNTGASKTDKMGPEKMAPTEGASSGASAGTSGDQKGMPPAKPNNDKSGAAAQ